MDENIAQISVSYFISAGKISNKHSFWSELIFVNKKVKVR